MIIKLLAKELATKPSRPSRFDLTDREASILASELAELSDRRALIEGRTQDEMQAEIYQALKLGEYRMFGIPVVVAA